MKGDSEMILPGCHNSDYRYNNNVELGRMLDGEVYFLSSYFNSS